jgi:DNA (cytosine-5)-methyltransferase 1
MTFGSLFAGIGGLDLGLERAGMRCCWQVEKNTQCLEVLNERFPGIPKHGEIRNTHQGLEPVNCIAGGDPCPKHSRARSNGDSRHPDLAGYFLSVVGRLRPWWVVRENVPAPTVNDFAVCLDALGYDAVVIRIESSGLTGQLRQRDFVIGHHRDGVLRRLFQDLPDGPGPYTTRLGTRPITPALTTHRTRYDSRDCYIWQPERGLRILDADEREALAGFPPGWTSGFSQATRARMYGNAAIPQVAEWIGRRIMEAGQATTGNDQKGQT